MKCRLGRRLTRRTLLLSLPAPPPFWQIPCDGAGQEKGREFSWPEQQERRDGKLLKNTNSGTSLRLPDVTKRSKQNFWGKVRQIEVLNTTLYDLFPVYLLKLFVYVIFTIIGTLQFHGVMILKFTNELSLTFTGTDNKRLSLLQSAATIKLATSNTNGTFACST
jgi:hypothetical protein